MLKPADVTRKSRNTIKTKYSNHEHNKTQETKKPKNSPQVENNKIDDLERKINSIQKESLKTIIQMQKDEFIQALNDEDGNVNPNPWHIIIN